jgi:hypothetical protein
MRRFTSFCYRTVKDLPISLLFKQFFEVRRTNAFRTSSIHINERIQVFLYFVVCFLTRLDSSKKQQLEFLSPFVMVQVVFCLSLMAIEE